MENQENVDIDTQENASKRRQTNYRNVLEQVHNLANDANSSIETAIAISSILTETDQLIVHGNVGDRVSHVEEVIFDATILGGTSTLLEKSFRHLAFKKSSYTKSAFIKKLIKKFGNPNATELEAESYLTLLPTARKFLQTIPKCCSLYNEYDIKYFDNEESPAKQKRNASQRSFGEKQKPNQIAVVSKEEDSIDETIQFVNNVLKKEYRNNNRQPIDYYEFVIDKESFEETIENMFWVTFLINDSLAKLSTDEDDNLILQPVRKEELEEARATGKENTQMISCLSYEMWEERKEIVNVGIISQYKKMENPTLSQF